MARVPTGNPRGRPKGGVKTGGRIAGKSLDRHARQLVSSELAGSILATFEQLGGTADMVKWAKENKTVFYTQVLSRLMPAPQRDEADFVQNNQFNIGDLGPVEAARRVAYALAVGIYDDPSKAPEAKVYFDPKAWVPPTDAPDMPNPYSQPVPEWESSLPMVPAERATESLENYTGSSGEQSGSGMTRRPGNHTQDPRAAVRDRVLAGRRKKDLL